ncbi:MAG: hypothetical protein JST80_01110 [Bdellovibrionales bacterium]|nr:hypothetical protein [Bdellovibrionales bacterium]
MSHIKFLFVLAISLFTLTANAGNLPSGNYSGFVSNNGFDEWCRLNRANINFNTSADGNATVMWEEDGFAPRGGFCQRYFDATFTKTGDNTWDVNFVSNFNLSFGRATLRDGILEITASYTGMNTGYQDLNVRLTVKDDGSSINYNRRIGRWGGSTLFATGTLYK